MRKYGRTSSHPKLKSYKKGGVIEGGPTPDEYDAGNPSGFQDETLAAIEAMKSSKFGIEGGIEGGSLPTDARGYPVRQRGTQVGGGVQFPVGDLTLGIGFDRTNINMGGFKKRPGGLSEVSVGVPFAGGELKAAYGRRMEEGETDRRFTIEFSKKF